MHQQLAGHQSMLKALSARIRHPLMHVAGQQCDQLEQQLAHWMRSSDQAKRQLARQEADHKRDWARRLAASQGHVQRLSDRLDAGIAVHLERGKHQLENAIHALAALSPMQTLGVCGGQPLDRRPDECQCIGHGGGIASPIGRRRSMGKGYGARMHRRRVMMANKRRAKPVNGQASCQ